MRQDPNNPKHWFADAGKRFFNLFLGERFTEELYLGYTYYKDGEQLIPPHEDVIEDFIEIPF